MNYEPCEHGEYTCKLCEVLPVTVNKKCDGTCEASKETGGCPCVACHGYHFVRSPKVHLNTEWISCSQCQSAPVPEEATKDEKCKFGWDHLSKDCDCHGIASTFPTPPNIAIYPRLTASYNEIQEASWKKYKAEKESWEGQEREAWNKHADIATDQDDGRIIGFTYIDVADYWLSRMKVQREEARQAERAALRERIKGMNKLISNGTWVKLEDLLASLEKEV